MEAAVIDILRAVSSDKAEPDSYTLISQYNQPSHQIWPLKNNRYEDFWKQYCSWVSDEEMLLPLAEKVQGSAPVVLECKLRFHYDEEIAEEQLYSDKFLQQFVLCCQTAMMELLSLEHNEYAYTCVVLESGRCWSEGEEVCTKFRIQFPYCRVDVSFQTTKLRTRIIQLLRLTNISRYLYRGVIGDWDTNIDPHIPQHYVPLYGARASKQEQRLDLSYIWPLLQQEQIEDDEELPDCEITKVFHKLTGHMHVQQGLVKPMILAKEDIYYWLPFCLSVYFHMSVTLEKSETLSIYTLDKPNTATSLVKEVSGLVRSDIDVAEQLLPFLSMERAEKEMYWLDVGRALYSVTRGSERGLQLWSHFSERSDQFTEEDCRDQYYALDLQGVSVRTIAWYAKLDNPEVYEQWHRKWCENALEKAASCLDTDVCEALYRYYWLDYVCASLTPTIWYKYTGHLYVRLDSGVDLLRTLSTDFLTHFEKYRLSILSKAAESNDTEYKEKCELLNKKFSNVICKLKKTAFKHNIMKEAREHFYNAEFSRLLDANENYMGMLNCVLETFDGNVYPRPGKPEDYISMCTTIPYNMNYTWKSEKVQEVLDWLHKIFVDVDLFEYAMRDFASMLRGRNSRKFFRVWSGEGNNSKSMLVKLFERTFGQYLVKIPVELLTAKKTDGGGANPALAQSKGTHAAIAEEPDDDEPMRKGIIKRYTGGDSFFARFLFDNGGKVEAMFNLILMCNTIPPIPNNDAAIRERTRVFPFLSRWDRKAPLDIEEQYKTRHFKMDPFFERKIPGMAQAFMWVLVQYYPRFCEDPMEEPAVVKEYTSNYWEKNDCYKMFAREFIEYAYKPSETGEEVRDETVTLTMNDIYPIYKNWFKENFPGLRPESNILAREGFIQVFGKQDARRRWIGVKLKEGELAQIPLM